MADSNLIGLTPSRNARIPVIIDTDPGVDDVIAILLAIASPELEILAFIVSFGNTDLQSSYLNILKVYLAISRHLENNPDDAERFPNFFHSRPILSRGATGPLEGELHSAQYFHGRDGLGDITSRHPDLNVDTNAEIFYSRLQLVDKPGIHVILDLIQSRPGRTITYIALGPLTNLANAMRLNGPAIQQKIGRVVCMGGALDVPGNTSPVSEFNFFADPYAAKELLKPSTESTRLPPDRFILLTLDITTQHELPFQYYKANVDSTFESTVTPSQASDKSPLVHFTSSFLERTKEVMREFGLHVMELHDIVAVWCAIENPPVLSTHDAECSTGWKISPRNFDIERTGELTRGMLVVDRRLDEGAYATGANRALQDSSTAGHGHSTDFDQGVLCVTETPGKKILLDMLLRRVWGVQVAEKDL